MGLVIATSQDNLSVVRKQIEQINREIDEDGEPRLGKEWRFLDSKSNLDSWLPCHGCGTVYVTSSEHWHSWKGIYLRLAGKGIVKAQISRMQLHVHVCIQQALQQMNNIELLRSSFIRQ